MKNRNIIITTTLFALGAIALSHRAQAISPAPDGGYPGGNTAEGQSALLSLSSGTYNTAVGFFSLQALATGNFNTAVGAGALFFTTADENTATGAGALLNSSGGYNTANGAFALFSDTEGDFNTATGDGALFHNTTGSNNTANGIDALVSNTTGTDNTATGSDALSNNTTGFNNVADGFEALVNNVDGFNNTATGLQALALNTHGNDNTATGNGALDVNITGSNNTAIGEQALFNNNGTGNTALGFNAGYNLTTGDDNIDIGNDGIAGESGTIRIGSNCCQSRAFIAGISGQTASGGAAVFVNSDGQLGTVTSSARFKDEIKPMGTVSEAILALRPVSFRYKKAIDPQGIPQFGLVAEEVEKVNPDLIVRDKEGKPQTVRYEQINAMLLNEFLKEHKKVQEQEVSIIQLKFTAAKEEATIAQQAKGMEALTTHLKEQDLRIQKVSAQVKLQNPPATTVANNQ